MGENSVSELILIVVETLVAVLVIGIIINYLDIGKGVVDNYNKESDSLTTIQENLEYEKYNGTTLKGSDVKEAMIVYTNKGTHALHADFKVNVAGSSYGSRAGLQPNSVEVNKINDLDVYTASLAYSTNGQVVSIIFRKQS